MTTIPRPATAGRSIRIRTTILILALLVGTACGRDAGPENPDPVPALPDGEVFAMVMVGTDESDQTTLGVDVAEMLSGEEAKEKAIEDGVIEVGEDLPNDFYIANDEKVYEMLHLSSDPVITVISGNDTSRQLEIEVDQLVALWEGEYAGEPVYGVLASTPIPMDVTVADGVITSAAMVYLP